MDTSSFSLGLTSPPGVGMGGLSSASPYNNYSRNPNPMSSSYSINSTTSSVLSSSVSRRKAHQTLASGCIVSENISHMLESYGSSLPSMIKAVLNRVDGTESNAVSYRAGLNGWSWLVFKRSLYIWKHGTEVKKSTVLCRELTLPPSELIHHHAKLVCVVGTGSIPSCIVVSPEGHINYWPSISNESVMVSANADLPGQECDSLSSIWPTGCILATTSASVMLIKPTHGPKPILTCNSLSHASKGWFGGFSRRVSYLMPLGGGSMETKRAKVAIPSCKEGAEHSSFHGRTIYVLAGSAFQTWVIKDNTQQCTNDTPIDDAIRKKFHEAYWDKKVDLRGIQIYMLDVVVADEFVAVLAGATYEGDGNNIPSVFYGIVKFDPKSPRITPETVELIPVDYTSVKPVSNLDSNGNSEDALYTWKLLYNQGNFYMVTQDRLLIISDKHRMDLFSCDTVESLFLGCGMASETTPIVFTQKHGLLAIRSNQSLDCTVQAQQTIADIRVPDHLALSLTQHNIHDLSLSEDHVNRYKSAFLSFCAKNMEECNQILSNLFPSNIPSLTPEDPLDIWTVAFCEKLTDDAPTSDPRWGSTLGRATDDSSGIRAKVLIKNFLLNKKKGLEIFFKFLNITGIAQRLTGIIIGDEIEATASVLYNSFEKIGFALALHMLQSEQKYRKFIDGAIKAIVTQRSEARAVAGVLSYNDIFYKDVSKIHQIFQAFVSIEEELLNSNPEPKELVSQISGISDIIILTFMELHDLYTTEMFGVIRQTFVQPLLESVNTFEVIPWHVKSSTLECLKKQTELLVIACKAVDDPSEKLDLFKQLERITDIILDGLGQSVEALKSCERYPLKLSDFEKQRSELIGRLIEIDPISSLSLAEKYLDFTTLLSVCYSLNDFERLCEYFEKYLSNGFPTFTFDWFIKQKKDSELINMFSKSQYKDLLGEYLTKYPHVHWHHSTVNEDYASASQTLLQLGNSEMANADDKKFLLCMGKLALLASGTTGTGPTATDGRAQVEESQEYQNINQNLNFLKFQYELSDEVLRLYGLDRSNMNVLTPNEMIEMFTTPSIEPDLENFWKAMQLVDYFPAEQRNSKLCMVIGRLIECEPWKDQPTEHPVDVIEASLLFKFIHHCIIKTSRKIDDFFPLTYLETHESLKDVFSNPSAKYLIEACYEHLLSDFVESDSERDGDAVMD